MCRAFQRLRPQTSGDINADYASHRISLVSPPGSVWPCVFLCVSKTCYGLLVERRCQPQVYRRRFIEATAGSQGQEPCRRRSALVSGLPIARSSVASYMLPGARRVTLPSVCGGVTSSSRQAGVEACRNSGHGALRLQLWCGSLQTSTETQAPQVCQDIRAGWPCRLSGMLEG